MNYYIINGEIVIGTSRVVDNMVTIYLQGGSSIAFTLEAYNKLERYSRLAQALNSPYLTEKDGRLHV